MASSKVCMVFICIMTFFTDAFAQNSPEDFVNAQSPARAEVGEPPLQWDETLAAYAQNYANQRSVDCAMEHSNGPYGENLAWGSWDISAKEAVDMYWVSEKRLYDYASNSCVGGECLHYTQIVWRHSTHVGCARSHCKNGNTFVICSYNPPGNIIGQRPY